MRIAGEKRYPRSHWRHPVFAIAQVGRHVFDLPCLKFQTNQDEESGRA